MPTHRPGLVSIKARHCPRFGIHLPCQSLGASCSAQEVRRVGIRNLAELVGSQLPNFGLLYRIPIYIYTYIYIQKIKCHEAPCPMTRSILTIVFPQWDEKGTGPIQPETLARHVDVARRESRKDSAGNPSFVTS